MFEEFTLGLIFGAFAAYVLIKSTYVGYRRAFKMYIAEQPADKQKEIDTMFAKLTNNADELASQTNLKLFKAFYNDCIEIRSFLWRKWMQN